MSMPGHDGPDGQQGQGQGQGAPPPGPPRNSVTLPTPLASLPPTAWRWIGGLLSTFVVLTLALGVVGLMTIALSGSESDVDDMDPTESAGAIRGLALLASFGWTGHAGFSYDDGDITGGASVTTPLTLYTVLALVALALAARWLTRRYRPTSRASLWLQIALVVPTTLVVLLVVGLIARFTEDDMTLSPLGFAPVLRFLVVITAAIVIGVALAVPRGRRIEALFGHRAVGAYRWVETALDAAFLHVAAWLAIGLVGGLFAAISLREDLPFGLSLGYLSTYGPMAAVLGHFGGISFAASGDQDAVDFLPTSGDFGDETLSLFSADTPWYLWLLPLLAVVVVVLIATRLTLLRAPGSALDARQLAITAGTFLVTWFVVVRLLGRLSAGGSAEFGDEGVSGDMGLGPAWWVFLLLGLCGLAVELVHGFIGARLVQMLPRGLVQRLVPRPHPQWAPYLGASLPDGPSGPTPPAGPGGPTVDPHSGPHPAAEDQPTSVNPITSLGFDESTTTTGAAATTATGAAATTTTGAAAAGYGAQQGAGPWAGGHQDGHAQQAPQQWGQPQPMSRRSKAVIGGCVGLLVLAGLGWVLVDQAGKRYFGPEGVALDYASALVDGRGDDAMEAGSVNIADDERALLGDAVYGDATGRPESAEVTEVVESDDGESAQIELEFEQEGERFTQTLTAERTGTTMLVFPEWELQPVATGTTSVTVQGSTLEVNGERIDLSSITSTDGSDETGVTALTDGGEETTGYEVSLPVFPGRYSFEVPGTTWTKGESQEQQIKAADDVEGSGTQSIELSSTPAQEFEDKVEAAVKKKIDDCSTDYNGNSPCPFDAPDLLGEDESIGKVEIEVNEYPELSKESLSAPIDGEEMELPLEGNPSITEKGKYLEDTFGYDKGDDSESEQSIDTYGWTAKVDGGTLTVSWEDPY